MGLAQQQPVSGFRPAALTRRRKAAIIVRLLLSEGADLPLNMLPPGVQTTLTREMGAMRYIDADTLRAVVGEFLDELGKIGLIFPGGIDGALSLLDGHISEDLAASLRKDDQSPQDVWGQIAGFDNTALAQLAEGESAEVAAVMLSKMPTSRAAELLGQMPGGLARRIACAVSQTGQVDPETVTRIGETLLGQLHTRPPRAFSDAPDVRIGAILNLARSNTRDTLLAGLDEDDTGFAEKVRQSIFTYNDIPQRVLASDVPSVVRAVPADALVAAIASAPEGATATFLLQNLSRRIADQTRDAVQDRGAVAPDDAEAAMAEIVSAIRALEMNGDIRLAGTDAA